MVDRKSKLIKCISEIWGSHSGEWKGYCLLDVMQCSLVEVHWCFEGTCCFHLQDRRVKETLHWTWSQHVPLKCWYRFTRLHVITSQKTPFLMFSDTSKCFKLSVPLYTENTIKNFTLWSSYMWNALVYAGILCHQWSVVLYFLSTFLHQFLSHCRTQAVSHYHIIRKPAILYLVTTLKSMIPPYLLTSAWLDVCNTPRLKLVVFCSISFGCVCLVQYRYYWLSKCKFAPLVLHVSYCLRMWIVIHYMLMFYSRNIYHRHSIKYLEEYWNKDNFYKTKYKSKEC
jgi:hypothetical protein